MILNYKFPRISLKMSERFIYQSLDKYSESKLIDKTR